LSIAFLGAAWWFLAPPPLGGSTSFVTVDGTSMLPNLHRSDLVALRPASAYRVGDVVGYHSPLIHRVVLHRIVAIHGQHYVLKGDNNTFLDPDQPTHSQVVGKLWFHMQSAGRAVQLLHVPWIVGALAVLLVLVLGLGRGEPRRHEREPARP
jgi:signal peptidase I